MSKNGFVRVSELGHDSPPRDEVHAAVAKVVEYAKMLGLHGVMILSPRCPTCCHLHAFSMQTDILADIGAEGTELAGLLGYFATVAKTAPHARIDTPADN